MENGAVTAVMRWVFVRFAAAMGVILVACGKPLQGSTMPRGFLLRPEIWEITSGTSVGPGEASFDVMTWSSTHNSW